MTGGRVSGVERMKARIKEFQARFPDKVAAAIYQEAQIELTEAKRRTPVWNPDVPVPKGVVPGALRSSGMVHEPEWKGKTVYCTISFGGAAVTYAVYVHEDPDAFHKIGQWKYLESVLNESRPHMAARIAKRLKIGTKNAKD